MGKKFFHIFYKIFTYIRMYQKKKNKRTILEISNLISILLIPTTR